MTIAVSSVVKPSKLLIAVVVAMCFATSVATGAAALSRCGVSTSISQAAMGAIAALFAFLGGFHLVRKGRIWRIDISGTGQIRLSGRDMPEKLGCAFKPHPWTPGLVRLLANSTLWPNLLLLRLQSEDGTIIKLLIFPDSVCTNDFRALSVALRWIALRQHDERSKIL